MTIFLYNRVVHCTDNKILWNRIQIHIILDLPYHKSEVGEPWKSFPFRREKMTHRSLVFFPRESNVLFKVRLRQNRNNDGLTDTKSGFSRFKTTCVENFKVTGAFLLKFCFRIKLNFMLALEVDELTQMVRRKSDQLVNIRRLEVQTSRSAELINTI